MAVPVIAASGTAVAGTGNLNVPYPSGISAGHLLLLIASDTGSGSFTNPSGWTVIRNNTTPSPNTAAWFKIAVGTESGTLTLTVGSSNPHIARMHRVTGGDSVNALVNNSGNDKVIPHPSITTTVGDSLVCVVGGVDDDETASSFTGETGGDLTLHSQDSTTTGSDHLLYLQTAGMASTGTISGGTWEFAGAKENYSHIAFAIYGNPVWDQDSYRFRDDDGNETGATWLAAANTTPPDIALDTNFRLRFLIQNTKAFTGGPATHDFRIEYRVNTGGGFGSWTNPDGQGNSIKPVKASLSNEFTDGSNTTQQLGSGTFTGGEMEESSYFMDGITKTVGNDEFELEFCLAFNSSATTPASAGDIFEFRIRYFDGGVQDLGSYTNTPSVTAAAGGATTPKTLSVTATGTPNFSNVTTFAKALSQTATGAVGFLRKISLTKAVAATGAPAFSRVATFLRTFAVGATGSPGFSFANIFQRTFAVAATGSPAFSRVVTFLRTFAVGATGAPAFSRVATFLRTFAVGATGAVGFLRQIGLTKSVTATGAPGFSFANIIFRTFAVAATGAAAFGRSFTAAVTAPVVATGAPAFNRVATFLRTLAVGATGSPAFSRIATHLRTLAVAATGAPAFSRVITFARTLAVAATGTVGFNAEKIVGLITRLFSVTATGSPALTAVPTFRRTLAVAATGAVGFLRKISLTFSVAATGASAFTRVATFLRTLAVTATGTAAQAHQNVIGRTFAVVATGTAALSRLMTYARSYSVTATGTAALARAATFVKAFAVGAVGTPALSLATTFTDVIGVVATGTAALSKKMFKTIAVAATGTPGFSTALVIPKLLAAIATGTANATQTFIAGVGPTTQAIRHLIHTVWQHISHKLFHSVTHHDDD